MSRWTRKPGQEKIRDKMKISGNICAMPGCGRQANMVGGSLERASYCSMTCASLHMNFLARQAKKAG